MFKQFEFILQDKLGEPRLNHEGNEIVEIGPSPNDIKGRVFLTKPDVRENMDRARVVELINEFDDKLDKDPLQCRFKVEFEKNTPTGKDTFLDDIMSYNNILDYVENLDKDPLRCKFEIEFEKNTPSSKTTHLDNIMSYNDMLDCVKRETNNEDSDYWLFRKILSLSLLPGKKVEKRSNQAMAQARVCGKLNSIKEE